MRTTSIRRRCHPPETFEELNAIHPLRPIHDDVVYDNAAEMVDSLAVLDHRTRDQQDYLDTLCQLIAAYDDEHCQSELTGITPLESLRYLMERSGMNGSELGRLLGSSPSLGGRILRGERTLNKDHIRKLSEHFRVNPGLFL